MSVKADVLERLGWTDAAPTKAYGQHFLIEAPILDAIADRCAELSAHVVEIGPGPGTLTERLLQRVERVAAVEKDRRLVQTLERLFADAPGFELHPGDVLERPLQDFAEGLVEPAFVGNLPYNISGPILARFVSARHVGVAGLFMLQEEVAERIAAPPGSKVYGGLSVLVQAVGPVRRLRRVSPQAFWPAPKVWSAVIEIEVEHPDAVPPPVWPRFEAIVRTSFQQRRKTLRNSLGRLGPAERLSAAADAAGIDLSARPETLAWTEFRRLAEAYDEGAPSTSAGPA